MRNGKLALTRKENQSITITTPFGEEIKVQLYQINGDQATLTIEAALDTAIVRSELLEQTSSSRY